jgi:hypothetical protein
MSEIHWILFCLQTRIPFWASCYPPTLLQFSVCFLPWLVTCSESSTFYKDKIRGRTIAQAVSRWLLTAARVRVRVWSCGICGGHSGAWAGFLRVLRFPLPIFIPPIAPQSSSSIIWGWYNRPVVAAVPSGLSLTQLRIIIKKDRIRLTLSSPCSSTAGRLLTSPVTGPWLSNNITSC